MLIDKEIKEQSVRYLAIVEQTYWRGSASLSELSASLSARTTVPDHGPATLRADIELLAHQGFPIAVGVDGRARICGRIPGFALRLTQSEARVLWACCVAAIDAPTSLLRPTDATSLPAAIAVIQEGLRACHFRDGNMPRFDVAPVCAVPRGTKESTTPLRTEVLTGEARRVFRWLRILDLVESRKVRTAVDLGAALERSERSVHNDLSVLRAAGIQVRFDRRANAYRAAGFNEHLEIRLTLPMAASLLRLFGSSSISCRSCVFWTDGFGVAMSKMSKNLRLVFEGEIKELNAMIERQAAWPTLAPAEET